MSDFFCVDKIKKDVWYEIVKVDLSANPKGGRRLLELGFVIGNKLKVLNKSALKKTFLIEINGYVLSVRSDIASLVKVK